MKLIVASGNPGKIREIKKIFSSQFSQILSMKEAGIFADPEENGTTFKENALIKAKAIAELLPKGELSAVLADDSGLVVDALDGAPGVYSARFAGEPSNDLNNNAKLLNLMMDVPMEKRTARFVAHLVLLLPDGRELHAEGAWEGKIAFVSAGQEGFGYDPLFIPDGKECTSAQLDPEEKNRLSHRGQALQKLAQILDKETVG